MPTSDQPSFLARAHRFLIYFGGLYTCFLILLTFPSPQRHLIFLHKVKWPLYADFSRPEKYGIAPQQAVNVNITTSDNVRLGAWFIYSDPFYASFHPYHATPITAIPQASSESSEELVSSALRQFPTVIHFHGNAGTRAVSFRVASYASYTTRLGVNVLAMDYRGYADSEGAPSEDGLNLDARAAWQWAIEKGADPGNIVIVGQSLGTGVAAHLAQELATEGTTPRGLVLISPFTSLPTLLKTYNLGGWVPLLKPLQSIPFAQDLILRFLKTNFDTKTAITNANTNIVLIHAEDDFDILSSHSNALFDTLLEPYLPPPALTQEELNQPGSITHERWGDYRAGEELRQSARKNIVRTHVVEGFGRINQFERGGSKLQVVFVESKWGGHDQVGRLDGVIDIVGDVLGVRRAC